MAVAEIVPEKWTGARLFYLWAAIAATSMILQFGVSSRLLSTAIFDFAYAIFVMAVVASEFGILRTASRKYNSLRERTIASVGFDPARNVVWRIRNLRFLTGLMFFSLPYGLWTFRSNRQTIVPRSSGRL